MIEGFVTRRRLGRPSPMHDLRIGDPAVAAARGAAGEFPGNVMPEPEGGRERVLATGLSLLLHAAIIGLLLLVVWLTPDEVIEEIIEITRIEEDVATEEAAPAPRVLAESSGRFDPAPMAVPPQIVNPVVVQNVSPRIQANELQLDTVAPVQAPIEVDRSAFVVEQVSQVQAVATATASPVAIDSTAPAIRGPIEIAAPTSVRSGPREITSRSANTVGIDTAALGSGSSVREGISSNRDVHGASEGVTANVHWAVGKGGLGKGGDGTGLGGGVTFEQCTGRPEVQAYLGRVRTRVLSRWVLPGGVGADQKVALRFVLDPAGTANRVEFAETGDPKLGESAVKAMRSASPFDPMSQRVRCLANQPLYATFRNPSVAAN